MISENVYSEVYEILSYMDKVTVMKIPLNILNTIDQKRNKNYISRINKEDILNRENVLPDTIKYLAWLDMNYWETEQERMRIKSLYRNALIEKEKLLKEKYSKDIFKTISHEGSSIGNNQTADDINIVCYKEEKWYKKIVNKLIAIFSKKRI